jgi:hypothetical protein
MKMVPFQGNKDERQHIQRFVGVLEVMNLGVDEKIHPTG